MEVVHTCGTADASRPFFRETRHPLGNAGSDCQWTHEAVLPAAAGYEKEKGFKQDPRTAAAYAARATQAFTWTGRSLLL